MKQYWWKILSVVILLYVLIIGISVPLGVGIEDFSPHTLKAGQNANVQITGYNSDYQQGEVSVWMKIDSFVLESNRITVENGRELVANFIIPQYLPTNDKYAVASLIVSDPKGTAILPNSISIGQEKIDIQAALLSWDNEITVNPETYMNYPYRNILQESIRNQFFHVPLWFSMIILMTIGMVNSIIVLRKDSVYNDRWTVALNSTAMLFGVLGIATGAIWANYTWGEPWSGDIKQNMAVICLLIYGAYFIFRQSIDDVDKKRRVSNAYNIFAYIAMIPLLFVIPRMTDSLHPGSGGNPGFGKDDLDNTMRMVFYPAIIGWALLGLWIASLRNRLININEEILEKYKYKK